MWRSRRVDRRRVQQAGVVSTVVPEEGDRQADDNDEEETALEERKTRIREKQLAFLGQEDLLPLEDDGVFMGQDDLLPLEDDSVTEDGSEYETDSEDEQTDVFPNKAVVFIPKSQRDTIAERQQLEEEQRLEDRARTRLDDRKAETKQIVVEVIRRDELQADNTAAQ